ncbi:hypothetical protein C8Q77DRAFT_45984 [Trametes polyzona]|nr:hypothetical protein C8Q77DRAFT_45984 [Trametes polyzona]
MMRGTRRIEEGGRHHVRLQSDDKPRVAGDSRGVPAGRAMPPSSVGGGPLEDEKSRKLQRIHVAHSADSSQPECSESSSSPARSIHRRCRTSTAQGPAEGTATAPCASVSRHTLLELSIARPYFFLQLLIHTRSSLFLPQHYLRLGGTSVLSSSIVVRTRDPRGHRPRLEVERPNLCCTRRTNRNVRCGYWEIYDDLTAGPGL